MSVATIDWRLYDQPELRAAIVSPLPGGREEVLIAAEGMHCAACSARLHRLLGSRVENLRVDLTSRSLEFAYDPSRVSLSSILGDLDHAGFEPQILAQDADLHAARLRRRRSLTRIGVAIIGSMQVMMLAWPGYFDARAIDPGIELLMRWSQLLLATPVVFYSGWPFLAGGWRSLRAGVPGMDLPVALSILVAWTASALRVLADSGELYFDAATMFVLLLGLARHFEGRTRAIAAARMRLLAGRRSLTTVREVAGDTETVMVGSLRKGDRLQVPPGEALAADGRLLDAAGELDESLLTGESRPVMRTAGEPVLAGSLNAGAATLRFEVEASGSGTRLSQITRLLQQAQSERPPMQLLADRYATHFIWAVLALSALGAALWWPVGPDRALGVALAVLVASCPCALSLAVPAVMAAASSHLARKGVLVARPRALAVLTDIDTVVFDKTGTLTRPELRLQSVQALAAVDAASCLGIAAALERNLTHPIARALGAAAPLSGAAEDVRLEQGAVTGKVEGRSYRLGMAEYSGLTPPAVEAAMPASWILLSSDEVPLAWFALAGERRPEAGQVIAGLAAQGIEVQLLTGDAEAPARALAREIGITCVHSRQTPEQKLHHLRNLQAAGHKVMAVGDGVNDAPFLAAADVAVAMPAGSAITQARADVILVGDSLEGLIELRSVARQARRRLHQNLLWALLYNLSILPLALSGWLTPWLAALGMSLSSLLVVGNALRIKTWSPPWNRCTS
ncbi:MAG TPA: cation-translocating P-type ATPase [Solimonas sp.]|nr:cation-translocating P-type ATPase [Solimonas sp.]